MWAGFKEKLGLSDGAARTPSRSSSSSYQVGAQVQLKCRSTGLSDTLLATVVQAPEPGRDGPYTVELYAPAAGEEETMNPFLLKQTVRGLRATDMLPCASGERRLTTVGRTGSSMCSVPLAELHLRGLGPNAEGRYARLGGLASRPDLNGLTCTVLRGPDQSGRYTVEVALEEGDESLLVVRPECLTLRIRQGSLSELTARTSASWGRPNALLLGEVVDPSPQSTELSVEQVGSNPGVRLALPVSRPQRQPSGLQPLEEQRPSSFRSTPHMSAAAAAALAGEARRAEARMVPAKASAAEVQMEERQVEQQEAVLSARDRKFEALDAELARCCAGGEGTEEESPAARLLPLCTPALGVLPSQSVAEPRPTRQRSVPAVASQQPTRAERRGRSFEARARKRQQKEEALDALL